MSNFMSLPRDIVLLNIATKHSVYTISQQKKATDSISQRSILQVTSYLYFPFQGQEVYVDCRDCGVYRVQWTLYVTHQQINCYPNTLSHSSSICQLTTHNPYTEILVTSRDEQETYWPLSFFMEGKDQDNNQRVLDDFQRTRLSRCRITWLLPHPLPPSSVSKLSLSQSSCVSPVELIDGKWGEGGGRGAKLNDCEKAWYSLKHSVNSVTLSIRKVCRLCWLLYTTLMMGNKRKLLDYHPQGVAWLSGQVYGRPGFDSHVTPLSRLSRNDYKCIKKSGRLFCRNINCLNVICEVGKKYSFIPGRDLASVSSAPTPSPIWSKIYSHTILQKNEICCLSY